MSYIIVQYISAYLMLTKLRGKIIIINLKWNEQQLVFQTIFVTEYWKTDHVRTFGQLLFISPANSHTHTLPVHCCINGLS